MSASSRSLVEAASWSDGPVTGRLNGSGGSRENEEVGRCDGAVGSGRIGGSGIGPGKSESGGGLSNGLWKAMCRAGR